MSSCKNLKKQSCRPAALMTQKLLDSYEAIVEDYIDFYRSSAKGESEYYAQLKTIDELIHQAGKALDSDGKKHPHQYRIGHSALKALEEKLGLLRQERSFKTFADLYQRLHDELSIISGIGELTIYDTTLRVGSFLGLSPDKVYLHAGTRMGAQNMGLNVERLSIETNEFPSAFNKLTAREIEDCLCIYKQELKAIANTH